MDLQTPTTEPERKPTRAPLPELPAPNKASGANQTCWYGGTIILATGLVGYVVPGLFSLHLNPVHNLILIVAGALAIWFGITAPDYTARKFCKWFGSTFLLVGIAGFAFGHRALSLTRPTITGLPEESSFLWQLVPGKFELGTADHVLHIIIGAVFLAAGFIIIKNRKTRAEKREEKEEMIWH